MSRALGQSTAVSESPSLEAPGLCLAPGGRHGTGQFTGGGENLDQARESACCPMLAGAICIRGATLRFKSKAGEIEVRAPQRFLKALYDWCDGRSTKSEIEALAKARWGTSRFAAFLDRMFASGVLIDASHLLDAAFDAVQLPSVFGRPALEETWEAERRRAHDQPERSGNPGRLLPRLRAPSMARLIDARHSAAAFGSAQVSADKMAALLDALYGLAGTGLAKVVTLGRRSTPSAGAFKSLRISLVLLRAAEDFEAGVYDVEYKGSGSVALHPAGDASSEWCRALLEGHLWVSAAGLLVVSTDTAVATLKYRSRALHFALIETGAALQNAGLAAAELDLGLRILGGYCADRLARACRLQGERVLGCAAFGSLPVGAEGRSDAPRKALHFRWGENGDDSLHIAGAEVVGDRKSGIGWGRSADALSACSIAVSEAVERYSYSVLGNCVAAKVAELDGALDPESLVLYSRDQYERADLGAHRFDIDSTYLWAPASRWGSNEAAWVPAECVYSATALPVRFARNALTRITSSGCATDVNIEVAIERAAFELIERDALARHWLAQSAGTSIEKTSWPPHIAARIARLAQQGCSVSLHVLQQELGPVMLVAIESEALGFSAIGTACGADPLNSLERALTEAEVVASVRLRQHEAPTLRARDVRKPMDHADIHSLRRHFRRTRALTRGRREESYADIARRWPQTLSERLGTAPRHHDLWWVDITAADAPLSPQGHELRTVRALIPGSIPIAFGNDAIPRGRLGRVSAAARFPHPMA
jgi:ribosomal protein S12 methylthiotransferase accessory factor